MNTTSSSAAGCAVAHALGERVEQQRVRRETSAPRSNRMPAGSAARRGVDVLLHAERRELRRQRDADDAVDACRRELGERVLDERLPVAHADGDRHVAARAARASAAACASVMSVSGERPPIAS